MSHLGLESALGDAQAGGIMMGAGVPIVPSNRAGSANSRVASCSIALLLGAHAGSGAR